MKCTVDTSSGHVVHVHSNLSSIKSPSFTDGSGSEVLSTLSILNLCKFTAEFYGSIVAMS